MAPKKKLAIKTLAVTDSRYEIPLPAPFGQLNQIPKLLFREDTVAKSQNKRCCMREGIYYRILQSTEQNSFDEDHVPVNQEHVEVGGVATPIYDPNTEAALFTVGTDTNRGCWSGHPFGSIGFYDADGTGDSKLMRVHLEVKDSLCPPDPPKRARIYSPPKQLIGFIKIRQIQFGQPGAPAYDILNADQKIVYKVIPEQIGKFGSIKYTFFDQAQNIHGRFDEIGESRFTLEITSPEMTLLNRVRLLAFTLVQECIRNW